MAHLQFNGKPHILDGPNLSLQKFLEQELLHRKRIAVELNREIIPRSQFDKVLLKPGDQIEIVAAIGGG